MMKLLVFKEYLKKIYAKGGAYINLLIKMAAMLFAVIVINCNIGYMSKIKSPLVVIMLGVMAAFLPNGINILILSGIIVAHLYQVSMELAVAALIIFLIMYLVYYRFTPKDSYVLILLPVLFFLKMPYLVPLVVGLVNAPVSVVSVVFGVIVYYVMDYAKTNGAAIANSSDDNGIQKIQTLLENILKNKEMWLVIITFAVVVILVYALRRISMNYARTIALVTGGLTSIVFLMIGKLVLGKEVTFSILLMLLMSIISMGITYLVDVMILSVDYSRTEMVQFEDDEYYYYVKAVPKINVPTQDVKVKRINAGASRRR